MSTGKKRLFVYLAMILSLFISLKLIKDIIRLKSTDNRLLEAETELQAAKQEQEELNRKLAEVNDRSWWEKQVRNVLKMTRSEEVIVIVPEAVGKIGGEPAAAKAMAGDNFSNFQKWLQIFNQ